MRVLVILILSLCTALPSFAQDDRTFLQGLIEDTLSDAGREVRIEGFEGALSSKAKLQSLTIADEVGIWLTLSDVSLDWSRSALFSGRLEVTSLTAKSIDLPRLPTGGEAKESAGSFALPDLPVAVQIGKIAADSVTLGQTVLGQAATLGVAGSMQLEGGEGSVDLAIERLDRAGEIALRAAFDNETRELSLDLSLEEAQGGLLATLLRLPGAPAVAFGARGAGPIDDYRAEVSLTSEGVERLGGIIGTKLLPESADRQIATSLSGDMTPLFAPDLRPFFGADVGLDVLALLDAQGGVSVKTFALTAAQMSFVGSVNVAPNGLPERFSLAGQIKGKGPVRLPVAGPVVLVDEVTLQAEYDRASDDGWTVSAAVAGLNHPEIALRSLQFSGDGTLAHDPTAATARLSFAADGIAPTKAALTKALGQTLKGQAQIAWHKGAAPSLSVLELSSEDTRLSLTGALALSAAPSGQVEGRLFAPDISRFAGLAGRPLGGAIEAQLERAVITEAGEILLELSGQGKDLRIGLAQADNLLRGSSEVRFQGGVSGGLPSVGLLDLRTPELTLSANADETGTIAVQARLEDFSALVAGVPGTLSLEGTVLPGPKTVRLDLTATGPAGLTVQSGGSVAADASTADLTLIGSAPLALANSFIVPRTAEGVASFDLALQGPLTTEGLRGNITTSGARIADPLAYVVLQDIGADIALADGVANLRAQGQAEAGGIVSTSGSITLTPPMASDLQVGIDEVTLTDGVLFTTRVKGAVGITGPLQGGAVISGDLDLGATELRIPSGSVSSAGPIPEITHRNEPAGVRLTRQRAGLLEQRQGTSSAFGLDLNISAPNQIFLRGSGLEAELGGNLRLTGTTSDVVPSGRFDLIRGRMDILGQRLNMAEGYATLQGTMDPYVRLVAETTTDEITARVTVEGTANDPTLRFSSDPDLPEDEVLAQLLFGRSAKSLSAFQAAQLAAAATGLAGSGGSTIVSKLRESFGLDDLDVASDVTGGTTVTAGKYLSDNLYTDVTVDSAGKSEINLNLDLTPSITLKGGAASDGSSNIGIHFQRDY